MTTAEAALVGAVSPRQKHLVAEELVDDVVAHASDDVELRFLPALERLCSALNAQARLSEAGRRSTRRSLVSALVLQLRLQRLLAEHPEIERLPFEGPLVVVGLFRTGSTLLQNLLAQHPDVRAPKLWELMHPVPRDGSTSERRRLIAATQSYVRACYRTVPAYRAVRYLDAELPDECHRLIGRTFTSDVYTVRYRIPRYADWLREQDMREPYELHRTLLRCLLWREPGGHVALKCPTHLWHLEDLAAAYPQGRVVRLHRDPVTAVASACSLTAMMRSAHSVDVDRAEIGRDWSERAEATLDAARRSESVHGLPVLDLRYDDLVNDPLATVATVCEFAGIRWTGAAEMRVRRFFGRNLQGRHGVHRYALEEFGLSRVGLEHRFADYKKEFGL
jgi:Sulfotransferase family